MPVTDTRKAWQRSTLEIGVSKDFSIDTITIIAYMVSLSNITGRGGTDKIFTAVKG